MGYKVKFDNGQTVEFDREPTPEDIEEAHASITKGPAKLDSQMSKIAGAGEAILGVGSSFLAAPAQGLRALGELAGGADLNTALERSESSAEALTYQPRTQTGKGITEGVMNTLRDYQQEVGNKFAGDQARLNQQRMNKGTLSAADLAAENTERAFGEVVGGIYAPGLVAPSRKTNAPAAPKAPVKKPVDKLEALKQQLETPEVKPEAEINVAADVARLHDQAIVDKLKDIDKELSFKEDLDLLDSGSKEMVAQGKLNERQTVMEQDVARQAGLDFNAAERARQEAAPTGAKELAAEQAVDAHPFVQKAVERVTKQEELIIKLTEQVKKGRAQAATLAREVKNLENFELALEKTRANVQKGTGEGASGGKQPVPFSFGGKGGKQRGAVNPDVFREGFEKIVEGVGKVTYHIKSRPSDTLPMVDVVAKLGKEKVGEYSFYSKEHDLVAAGAATDPSFRHQGIAKGAYKAVAELGNDIVPSGLQTKEGKAMWEGFKRNGLADPNGRGYIPKGQRGALLIDPSQSKQGKFLEDSPALKLPTIIPERLTIDQVKEISKAVPDVEQNAVQRFINLGTKGGIYQGLKTDHPIVKYTYEHFSEADRLARGDIQSNVHDKLGPATRLLEKGAERVDTWDAVNLGDMIEKQITPEQMRASGYSEKQIAYVETHRAVMDAALEAGNRARKVAGMKPITKRQGYAIMKMTGDYRQMIYKLDENGDRVIVGAVGSNFRPLLKHRAKQFMEQGYELGEVKYHGGVPRHKGSAQESLAQVLEIIAKDDPNVAEFIKVMEEISINEAYSFMNARKHTLAKKGIFGMEGRKTDEGISPKLLRKLAEKNADEGLQAQLDYAEVMFKWGRMSEAVEKVGPVLADATIDAPNAKLWAEHYVQNALGYNPSKMGHYLEQAIAEGLGSKYNIIPGQPGYSVVRSGMALARKSVNTVLLSLDPIFNLTNVVQPFKAMPGMMAYLQGKGLAKDFDFGTGYLYLGKAALTSWRARTKQPLTEVEAGAFSYAKTHRVYGSDLVEQSNRGKKDFGYKVDKVANFALSNIESGTRELMFLSMTEMLHKNGLSVKNGLYEAAHNLTDMAMNNYSAVERPPMYNAAGPLGDMAVNLSSFKHNELSRIALFARQIAEEKTAKPLLAELATQIAYAGVKGVVAYEAADYLYRFITKKLGKPDSLSLAVIRMSEAAGREVNKLTGAKKDGLGDASYALSHGGFSLLGLDMSKRLGLGHVVGDNAIDIAFPGGSKLVDIGAAGAKAISDPTEMNAKRFASEVVPRPFATNMDLEWFSKGEQGANKRTLEAGVKRTPLDMAAKRLGGTGIHESVEKEKLYQTQAIKQAYADRRIKPLEHARDELFSTGKVSEETVKAYLKPEGDINTLMSDISRMAKEQKIPAKDRELLKATMSRSITSLRHAQRLKEVYEDK